MRSQCLAPLVVLLGLIGPARAEPVEYKLGPEDKLQIKVFDWRTGSGEAYQWTALNGEFIVGASGNLSLPLLGDIHAMDATTAAVADAIAERLQTKIGLAQRPDASVQVIKYRPFYIMGVVDKQGEYDYRPDLSVLQAVSLAGGLGRAGDGGLLGMERDALVNRGDLRTLSMAKWGLLVRQARLDAQIQDADAITLSPELKAHADDPAVARAIREEQALFETRRAAIASQTEALTQSRSLLDREVVALAAKDASLARQLAVTRQELESISGLVSAGLAVLPRKLAIEQNAAQYESSRLDVQLATLRAQQDISKTARDTLELHSKAKNDALTEAADVRTRLSDVVQRLETAQSLLFQSEVRAPMALAASGTNARTPVYSITRTVDGQPMTLQVEEGDRVMPGDVIRVVFAPPTGAPQMRSDLTGSTAQTAAATGP